MYAAQQRFVFPQEFVDGRGQIQQQPARAGKRIVLSLDHIIDVARANCGKRKLRQIIAKEPRRHTKENCDLRDALQPACNWQFIRTLL
jgi:hypothetical protein